MLILVREESGAARNLNLNTSNVNVNHYRGTDLILFLRYLNTSNVNVNL